MISNAGLINRQCKRTCDRFSFFDQKIAVEKLTGLSLLAEIVDDRFTSVHESDKSIAVVHHSSSLKHFVCNICDLKLDGPLDMRDHFKSDWHLANVSRSLTEHSTTNSMVFQPKTYDVSNMTEARTARGSCTNSDYGPMIKSSLTSSSHKQLLLFRNKNAEVIGINRCVLFTRKTMPHTMDELLARVSRIRQGRKWAILLYSGGKFAGGIFDGFDEVVHKTLHHYTVRAKQGGSQFSYDSAGAGFGGAGAKSAGANLRRHGEVTIRREISDLLHNKWRAHLQSCQLIFIWSPKVHRNIFFNPPATTSEPASTNLLGNDNANSSLTPDAFASEACAARLGMTTDDVRLRNIPYRSKHINYAHVKGLHKELSTFDVYDNDSNLEFISQSERTQWRHLSESGDDTLIETKSGRLMYGPPSLLSSNPNTTLLSLSYNSSSSSSGSSTPSEVSFDEDVISDTVLENNDASKPQKGVQNLANLPENSIVKGVVDDVDHDMEKARKEIESLYLDHHTWHRRLRVAIASGDCEVVRSLLPSGLNSNEADLESHSKESAVTQDELQSHTPSIDSSLPSVKTCLILLNYPLADQRTLLHIAVEFQTEPDLIRLLLESGCDPSIGDATGETPFKLAIRLRKRALANVFRRFRFHQPTRYDYEKAQIPAPLDPSREAAKAERERERVRKQKQRQKEKREAERIELARQEKEAAEQARFLALSGREKRALAAERRLTSAGETNQVFNRCFQCGLDISGKVPFTYLDYSFCTPSCLKLHRTSSSQTSKR